MSLTVIYGALCWHCQQKSNDALLGSWHLDHSLKVINAVVKNMEQSDPSLYKDNFSFVGKLLLAFNYFPRGKAKTCKTTRNYFKRSYYFTIRCSEKECKRNRKFK